MAAMVMKMEKMAMALELVLLLLLLLSLLQKHTWHSKMVDENFHTDAQRATHHKTRTLRISYYKQIKAAALFHSDSPPLFSCQGSPLPEKNSAQPARPCDVCLDIRFLWPVSHGQT